MKTKRKVQASKRFRERRKTSRMLGLCERIQTMRSFKPISLIMNTMETNNEWLIPLLDKRSTDGIRILLDLIDAGISRGEVSANDVKHRVLAEPNIIGGIFKILHKFGFVHTDKRIKTTGKQKHARRVDVWRLESHSQAIAARKEITNVLFKRATPQQQELF